MDFDLQWILIGLPVAFALGWLASRFDLRQLGREPQDAPRAYFKGLNLLLNEQQDKAIDAFIEAAQNDPDATELHFGLGNLFRRRGEFERAVRVHQHLLARGDLKTADRDRAQHELAQDFLKAGLFDRAEAAYRALESTPFATEARLALLALAERSRDWRGAAEVAGRLEQSGGGSFATRIAHYWCELAEEADAKGRADEADTALRRAREAAPLAARPLVLTGQRRVRAGDTAGALDAWSELRVRHPESFALVCTEFAAAAVAAGRADEAATALEDQIARHPSLDVLRALETLRAADAPEARAQRLLAQARRQPTLSAAQALLALPREQLGDEALQVARDAIGRAARPLQRYRCAACGFEAQRWFWQCPGCLGWDSFPPQRLEET